MIENLTYTLETFKKDIEQLSKQIQISKVKYDGIICITRGGIVPTGFICQHIGIRRIYIAGGKFNDDNNFIFTNELVKAEGKLLLISDICKSGRTLNKIIEKYQELSDKKLTIDIACLHYFPNTSKDVTVKYYCHSFEREIFIKYPWETL